MNYEISDQPTVPSTVLFNFQPDILGNEINEAQYPNKPHI